MKSIVILDLDGTLADGRHRLHLLPTKDQHLTKSWVEFNLAAGDDAPFEDNINLGRALYRAGFKCIILTGRSAIARDITIKWLAEHGVLYDDLIMRGADDDRKDTVIKEEYLRSIGLENILCCFDDLPQVAYHLRSIGLTCHLVTHYDEVRTDLISHGSEANEV